MCTKHPILPNKFETESKPAENCAETGHVLHHNVSKRPLRCDITTHFCEKVARNAKGPILPNELRIESKVRENEPRDVRPYVVVWASGARPAGDVLKMLTANVPVTMSP